MIETTPDGFRISLAGHPMIAHTASRPFAAVGSGRERIDMYRGNFDISDTLERKTELPHVEVDGATIRLRAAPGATPSLVLELSGDDRRARLAIRHAAPGLNRFWFRMEAEPDERVWGCGEQMSYLDLRRRRYPLWTSEPGVGRDKSTEITRLADETGRAGGDYWTTNYPQPTYLTSRRVAVHVETTAYSAFDFTAPDRHELEIWTAPEAIEMYAAPDLPALVETLSTRFGRPPRLPDWVLDGAVVGLKQGAASFDILERYVAAGVRVAALWCEDWAGVRETSFGTRLFWDWTWSAARYPDLPARIAAPRARGIRFMGYVNPYLCDDGALFGEAVAGGHLATDAGGAPALVDFGEFLCGVVDFTRPETCDWFAGRILRANMLDLGLSGWMADFGEYLPTDVHLASGLDARLAHNAWPTIWARVNADALAAASQTGEALFFMRAGYTGVQRHCPLLWAGDQSVDFSRHDGLRTVVTGALSSGLLGNPYHHSDIGGYTSLFGNVRTLELLLRWAEMAAFTPVMRTHEGNRPAANLQFHESEVALAHLARMTRIHHHLAPYVRTLVDEAVARGLPLQRPLFLHFPDDPAASSVEDQYLYGPDLLVAPVHEAGADRWPVLLPAGAEWVHAWSGAVMPGGRVEIACPLGRPPVFWRRGSTHAALFTALAGL